MALGLDGFLYEVTVDGKASNYHFWDPEDATNVADTTVSNSDSNGATDERSNAEAAYAQVSKALVEKRTARQAKAEADVVTARKAEEARVASVQSDFLQNSKEQEMPAAGTEKREDGTTQTVYNTQSNEDTSQRKK